MVSGMQVLLVLVVLVTLGKNGLLGDQGMGVPHTEHKETDLAAQNYSTTSELENGTMPSTEHSELSTKSPDVKFSNTCRNWCGRERELQLKQNLCSCDTLCRLYNSCCWDFETTCPTIDKTGRALVSEDLLAATIVCDEKSGVYVVSECPPGREIIEPTERGSAYDLQSLIFVTDVSTLVVYKNEDIFRCFNPGKDFLMEPWGVTFDTRDLPAVGTETTEELWSILKDRDRTVVPPPASYKGRKCDLLLSSVFPFSVTMRMTESGQMQFSRVREGKVGWSVLQCIGNACAQEQCLQPNAALIFGGRCTYTFLVTVSFTLRSALDCEENSGEGCMPLNSEKIATKVPLFASAIQCEILQRAVGVQKVTIQKIDQEIADDISEPEFIGVNKISAGHLAIYTFSWSVVGSDTILNELTKEMVLEMVSEHLHGLGLLPQKSVAQSKRVGEPRLDNASLPWGQQEMKCDLGYACVSIATGEESKLPCSALSHCLYKPKFNVNSFAECRSKLWRNSATVLDIRTFLNNVLSLMAIFSGHSLFTYI
ncbi:uncharacterized protein LOC101852468 [Aplysia californica]|uniref:Uncharacterized protein LOC101852468 n=1 Tax=Aplysia californica TaxID=6500 RepID=A0ABM0ZY88_APLCA|nr:uncharacterized protein LOC101852468 [Aplysia californica]